MSKFSEFYGPERQRELLQEAEKQHLIAEVSNRHTPYSSSQHLQNIFQSLKRAGEDGRLIKLAGGGLMMVFIVILMNWMML